MLVKSRFIIYIIMVLLTLIILRGSCTFEMKPLLWRPLQSSKRKPIFSNRDFVLSFPEHCLR